MALTSLTPLNSLTSLLCETLVYYRYGCKDSASERNDKTKYAVFVFHS